MGEWAVEEPHVLKGIEGDKGLVVKNKAAHHAISAKFPSAIDNKGKTLVVQYEVKLQSMFPWVKSYLRHNGVGTFTDGSSPRWIGMWWSLS